MTRSVEHPKHYLVNDPQWVYDKPANAFVWRGRPAPYHLWGGSGSRVNCKANGEGKILHPPDPDPEVMADPDRIPDYLKGTKSPLRYIVVEGAVADGQPRPVRNVVNATR